MFAVGIPEVMIFVLPIMAGIVAGKYVGRFVNFWIMLTVFQIDIMLLAFGSMGQVRPRLLIPVIFLWPPLSLGQFVPPLVFALVALVVYRLRYARSR